MKVYSNIKPFNYFYHIQPKNPLLTLVRFCENLIEIENGWQYDEYCVEIKTCENVEEYIQNHYLELHAEAIGKKSAIQTLSNEIDSLLISILEV